MTTIIRPLFLSLALVGTALAGDDSPKTQPINLAAVMRLAGAKNLGIQIAQQRFLEAQAAHEQALLQFFPFVSPGVSLRRHEGNIQTVDGQIIDTNKESLGTGVNVTAQLELGETIFKTMIAKRLATAAQFAAEAQRQESVYQAVAAFFELVRAKSARGVAVESVRISDSYAGELDDAKLRDEITRQVVEAHARAHSLADQIEFSRKALGAAEQSLKLARQRQQFGVGEVLENIQAEQDLTRARLDYLTAITGHNRAQFALQRATGGGGK